MKRYSRRALCRFFYLLWRGNALFVCTLNRRLYARWLGTVVEKNVFCSDLFEHSFDFVFLQHPDFGLLSFSLLLLYLFIYLWEFIELHRFATKRERNWRYFISCSHCTPRTRGLAIFERGIPGRSSFRHDSQTGRSSRDLFLTHSWMIWSVSDECETCLLPFRCRNLYLIAEEVGCWSSWKQLRSASFWWFCVSQ